MQTMNEYATISASGGKDSTALTILMVERGLPIDAVLYADVGMNFPEMDVHMEKLDDYLYRHRGIHITVLRHPKGFEYLMFDQPKVKPDVIANRKEKGISLYGNGWPGVRVRWCTGQLKTHLLTKEGNRIKQGKNIMHYIGIAADESHRCKPDKNKRYPLTEWGITEADALKICYEHGFNFGGLYEIYYRVSCFCCPFQCVNELRNLRHYHPDLWTRLLNMDNRARAQFGPGPLGQFKKNWSVERFEERFAQEDKQKQPDIYYLS